MLYNFKFEVDQLNEQTNTFSKFSKAHPGLEIQLWCNSQNDIIELRGEKELLDKAIPDLEEALGDIIKIFLEINHVQIVFKPCECAKFPLDVIFTKYDCLELPPTKFIAGREIVNLIVSSEDAGLILIDIQRDIPAATVNVLKLAPLNSVNNPYPFFLPLDNLIDNLTEKQYKALTLAFKKGYYETPRSKSLTDALAKEMDIRRRTFNEHLKKAEKKIMRFLIPAILTF